MKLARSDSFRLYLTEIDFSAKIVRFRLVGGMHPEMEPNFWK